MGVLYRTPLFMLHLKGKSIWYFRYMMHSIKVEGLR